MAENEKKSFATTNDVINLWHSLTNEEMTRCENLLPVISDSLRYEAKKVGKDLDEMITDGDIPESVVKSVTVDIASRYIEQTSSNQSSLLSQESQSALGYAWSGTYVNTGGGISILNKDLKRLGLLKQKYGMVDLYGIERH